MAGASTSQTEAGTNPNGTLNLSSKKIGFSVGGSLKSLSNQELDQELADISSLGIKWLRIDIGWDLVQPVDNGQYDWTSTDRIVLAARKYNLQLLPVLAYAPEWARQPACKTNFVCAPADNAAFANFAQKVVRRYTPMGVNTWEVWNEPNNNSFWLPQPDAAAYVELLKATYTAIKQVDPNATVLSGGLSPAENISGHIAPRDFLTAMYQDGARNYFDALSYHPFSYPILPDDVTAWSSWSQMSDLDPSIRSIMVANGDGNKQVWATEYGTPSGGASDLNETLQALSFRQALEQMGNKPWLGAMFFHTYRDSPGDPNQATNDFGIIRTDGSRKPAYGELQNMLHQQ
ncbi:MAG: GH39 family glycosyl hydrolase [Thermoleophilia bacterium]